MLKFSFINGLVATTLVFAAASGMAQDWPAKPVRMVVPFAAGGTTDITARVVAVETVI